MFLLLCFGGGTLCRCFGLSRRLIGIVNDRRGSAVNVLPGCWSLDESIKAGCRVNICNIEGYHGRCKLIIRPIDLLILELSCKGSRILTRGRKSRHSGDQFVKILGICRLQGPEYVGF